VIRSSGYAVVSSAAHRGDILELSQFQAVGVCLDSLGDATACVADCDASNPIMGVYGFDGAQVDADLGDRTIVQAIGVVVEIVPRVARVGAACGGAFHWGVR